MSPRHRNAYEGINQNPTWHSSGRFFFACELDLDDSKVVNSGHNWKWLVFLSHLAKLDLGTWGKIGSQFYNTTFRFSICGKIGSIFLWQNRLYDIDWALGSLHIKNRNLPYLNPDFLAVDEDTNLMVYP